VQSPMPNIFEYFVCRNVLGSTQRNPTSLVSSGCFFKTAGGPIGGVTWRREYLNNNKNVSILNILINISNILQKIRAASPDDANWNVCETSANTL